MMREKRCPFTIEVDGVTMIVVPPPIDAPITNAVWPPVPVYIIGPSDSALACPVKSTFNALLIDISPSSFAISRMSSVKLKSYS